jgi:hypothetical protein
MILLLFKTITGNTPNLKIDLIFQYHNSSSNALILYNLSSKSINNVTLEVVTTKQNRFQINIEHISPKIGELIALNDLKSAHESPFEGIIDHVNINLRGTTIKFTPKENIFTRD